MSTFDTLGQSQQQLLKALLRSGDGLTVDDLARALSISRNAVNQHIASLEGRSYIESIALSRTRGRPGKRYSLTPRGRELFPRHYDLFARMLTGLIQERQGTEGLRAVLHDLGRRLAQEFAGRMPAGAPLQDKVGEMAVILHELGYDAAVSPDQPQEITANNCVFHQLAAQCREVCELDLALMATVLNAEVEHRECMVRGGRCCRFRIGNT